MFKQINKIKQFADQFDCDKLFMWSFTNICCHTITRQVLIRFLIRLYGRQILRYSLQKSFVWETVKSASKIDFQTDFINQLSKSFCWLQEIIPFVYFSEARKSVNERDDENNLAVIEVWMSSVSVCKKNISNFVSFSRLKNHSTKR